MEVLRISDWASDLLPLRLASAETCAKVLSSTASDLSTRTALCIILLFQRTHFFSVNCKSNLNNIDRVKLLWASLIFFLHLNGVSIHTKRNFIIACIANCFILMRSDVVNPHRATSEPSEHTFGHARSIEREFTVKVWGQIVVKLHERYRLMYKNNFERKSCQRSSKGYDVMATVLTDASPKSNDRGGPVDMSSDLDDPVSFLVWCKLRPIINQVNRLMCDFLSKVFGVTQFHSLTKQFAEKTKDGSPTELLEDFLLCMNKGEVNHFMTNKGTVVSDPEDHCDDVRATDMECKDHGALQAAFEERMKEKCLNLLCDLSQEDSFGTGEIGVNQMQIDDYKLHLVREQNEHFDVDRTSSHENSKVAMFSNAWYAVERILKSTDIENISAAFIMFAYKCMYMRERDSGGSVTDEMKYKTITKRYFSKTEDVDTNKLDMNEGLHIKRGSIVEIKGRACRFVVIGIGNKYHNKWFLLPKSQETPVWPAEKGKGKSYRLHLRQIVQDRVTGIACFKSYSALRDTRMEKKNSRAYVVIDDLNDIEKIHEGRMEMD